MQKEMIQMIDFSTKKGFICDMDGVIYHGNQVLPGVVEFIDWLHRENKEFLFLTNNSGYTPRELQQKLARMGLDVSEEHFYTNSCVSERTSPWLFRVCDWRSRSVECALRRRDHDE